MRRTNAPCVQSVELFAHNCPLDEKLPVLFIRPALVKCPSRLDSEFVELSQYWLLFLIRKRHIIFDRVQSS